jgi:predicted metal-binding membrane protein
VTFRSISGLLFAASATATFVLCAPMSAMGMPMPGGWTMSMAWMRMPGQTWPSAAASFFIMWNVMMVAMMLPSLVPMLWRYRQALERRRGRLTAIASAGYFLVWIALGLLVYPLGLTLASIEMRQPAISRAVPIVMATVISVAGAIQFTSWKQHHLHCCREAFVAAGAIVRASDSEAWRHGVRLGLQCVRCCGNLMAILLVIGVMDLRAMALVTSAITAERLAPMGERVARATGVVIVATGLLLFVYTTP